MSREFGATAWGRDWLRLAEPTSIAHPNPALPRARSLARTDRVYDLDIAPGHVTAVVDDRGRYRVHITVSTWNDAELARAGSVLIEAPASEDLPDCLHTALRDAGQDLAPNQASLTTTCSCRSRRFPCLHLLATYFELARRFDERPRLALVLHGLTNNITSPNTARIPLSLIDPSSFYGPLR
nr:putative SWIM Zn-finger [uncultured bacterium]